MQDLNDDWTYVTDFMVEEEARDYADTQYPNHEQMVVLGEDGKFDLYIKED